MKDQNQLKPPRVNCCPMFVSFVLKNSQVSALLIIRLCALCRPPPDPSVADENPSTSLINTRLCLKTETGWGMEYHFFYQFWGGWADPLCQTRKFR